jgi:hypothetical protein
MPRREVPVLVRPDAVRPDLVRPELVRPELVRPDGVLPGAVLPDDVLPERDGAAAARPHTLQYPSSMTPVQPARVQALIAHASFKWLSRS